jgi:hypothetical protein
MIYYRMSSVLSVNKPPKFEGDRFRIAKTCLKTFVKAFEDIKPEIYFMLDKCGKDYLEMIQKICSFKFTYDFTSYGNYASCLKQYILADQNKDDILMFVEDDYLWREGIGKYFISAIKELGIVSPYDNPDFYISEPYRSRKEDIKLINNWHWRTIQSTPMTFGITRDKFLLNRKLFDYHGPNDGSLWQEIPDKLWCPIPSFATHFVNNLMAPSVDWSKYY